MVRVVKILFVILLLVSWIFTAVELSYNPGFTKIDIFSGLSAVNIVSAVGEERPHLVEIQRFAVCSILVAPLPVLTVNIGGVVA